MQEYELFNDFKMQIDGEVIMVSKLALGLFCSNNGGCFLSCLSLVAVCYSSTELLNNNFGAMRRCRPHLGDRPGLLRQDHRFKKKKKVVSGAQHKGFSAW